MTAARTSVNASCVDSSSDDLDTGRNEELYENSRLLTPMRAPMPRQTTRNIRENHRNGRGTAARRPGTGE